MKDFIINLLDIEEKDIDDMTFLQYPQIYLKPHFLCGLYFI
ncbi:MAG: hypothetical protein RR585_07525 [Coprobacillus sp.]